MSWADALAQPGEMSRAADLLEEGVDGLRAAGDVRRAALAMARLGGVLFEMNDPRSGGLAEGARALLEDDEPSPEKVRVMADAASDLAVRYKGERRSPPPARPSPAARGWACPLPREPWPGAAWRAATWATKAVSTTCGAASSRRATGPVARGRVHLHLLSAEISTSAGRGRPWRSSDKGSSSPAGGATRRLRLSVGRARRAAGGGRRVGRGAFPGRGPRVAARGATESSTSPPSTT